MPIVPFTQPQAKAAPAAPQINPTMLAMAAALMHQEGKLGPKQPEPTKAKSDNRD